MAPGYVKNSLRGILARLTSLLCRSGPEDCSSDVSHADLKGASDVMFQYFIIKWDASVLVNWETEAGVSLLKQQGKNKDKENTGGSYVGIVFGESGSHGSNLVLLTCLHCCLAFIVYHGAWEGHVYHLTKSRSMGLYRGVCTSSCSTFFRFQ